MEDRKSQSTYLDPIGKTTVVDEIVGRLMGLIIDDNLMADIAYINDGEYHGRAIQTVHPVRR